MKARIGGDVIREIHIFQPEICLGQKLKLRIGSFLETHSKGMMSREFDLVPSIGRVSSFVNSDDLSDTLRGVDC